MSIVIHVQAYRKCLFQLKVINLVEACFITFETQDGDTLQRHIESDKSAVVLFGQNFLKNTDMRSQIADTTLMIDVLYFEYKAH